MWRPCRDGARGRQAPPTHAPAELCGWPWSRHSAELWSAAFGHGRGGPPMNDITADHLTRSQRRWRGDESDEGLTWGVRMEGDAFVDFLSARAPRDPDAIVVEIGPGYGRITEALLRRGVPFKRYVGYDISEARVRRLRQRFIDPRLSFEHCDILKGAALNGLASLTFGSAVFEHFYPDFGPALAAISRFTKPGGALV